MVQPTMWSSPTDGRFHWRQWDGEYVVYDAISGDTHRLNELGAAVLHASTDGPVSVEHLLGRVSRELSLPADESLRRALTTLLEEFEQLGLVDRVEG